MEVALAVPWAKQLVAEIFNGQVDTHAHRDLHTDRPEVIMQLPAWRLTVSYTLLSPLRTQHTLQLSPIATRNTGPATIAGLPAANPQGLQAVCRAKRRISIPARKLQCCSQSQRGISYEPMTHSLDANEKSRIVLREFSFGMGLRGDRFKVATCAASTAIWIATCGRPDVADVKKLQRVPNPLGWTWWGNKEQEAHRTNTHTHTHTHTLSLTHSLTYPPPPTPTPTHTHKHTHTHSFFPSLSLSLSAQKANARGFPLSLSLSLSLNTESKCKRFKGERYAWYLWFPIQVFLGPCDVRSTPPRVILHSWFLHYVALAVCTTHNTSCQFSSVSISVSAQDDVVVVRKAHTRSAPSLSSLPKVALETVPISAWSKTDHSKPWRVECWPLPFSTPLPFRRSMLWCSGLSMLRKFLKPLSTSALPSCRPEVISAVLVSLSAHSFPLTLACPGQQIHRSLCSYRLRIADSTFP